MPLVTRPGTASLPLFRVRISMIIRGSRHLPALTWQRHALLWVARTLSQVNSGGTLTLEDLRMTTRSSDEGGAIRVYSGGLVR